MRSFLLLLLLASDLPAVNVKDQALVHERMLVLDLIDSQIQLAMPGRPVEEKVLLSPLDMGAALDPKAWHISSPGKPDFSPVKVGRKSKGRDYLMHQNPWRIDHGMEHLLYLELPQSLKAGISYRLSGGVLERPITLDPATARSESIHVNQVGYRPGAVKRGFISQWAGDLGPVDFGAWAGKPFELVDLASGKAVFQGLVAFRKPAEEPDSGQSKEGNHLKSGLWVADFSAFQQPGRYVLSVPGIGRSYPFEIGAHVYRKAFQVAMRGLYHQRCGTALKKPWGAYERAACHVPASGKILQSKIRRMDRQCDACQDVESTGEIRDIAGGWHDAGDWDREPWHFFVPMTLCLAYEMAPKNFKDGELWIPESNNGLPDILDEAQWGLDYWKRLQRPDGGVSVGLFLDKFPQPGQGAEDGDGKRYLYAEDPQASYRYAAAACHFAFALQKAGRGALAPAWIASARKAYAWAEKNQRPGDLAIVRDDRLHASACLFHATQENVFHEAFKKDLLVAGPEAPLTLWDKYDQLWAVFAYLSVEKGADPALQARLRAALRHFARSDLLEPAARRGMGGAASWYRPLAWGGITQPEDLPLLASFGLAGDAEALDGAESTLGLLLGANPLNLCYVSGIGSRQPDGIFHPDSWMHLGQHRVAPGLLAMGPSAYDKEGDPKAGPWDVSFTHLSFYPPAKGWPALELYADARICYPMNEFTVGQIAMVAANLGMLAGEAEGD